MSTPTQLPTQLPWTGRRANIGWRFQIILVLTLKMYKYVTCSVKQSLSPVKSHLVPFILILRTAYNQCTSVQSPFFPGFLSKATIEIYSVRLKIQTTCNAIQRTIPDRPWYCILTAPFLCQANIVVHYNTEQARDIRARKAQTRHLNI